MARCGLINTVGACASVAAPMAVSKRKAAMAVGRGNAGRTVVKPACLVAVAVMSAPTATKAAPTATKASQVSISTSVAVRKSAAVTTTAIAVVAAITAIAVVAAITGTVAAVATTTEDEGGSHAAYSALGCFRSTARRTGLCQGRLGDRSASLAPAVSQNASSRTIRTRPISMSANGSSNALSVIGSVPLRAITRVGSVAGRIRMIWLLEAR